MQFESIQAVDHSGRFRYAHYQPAWRVSFLFIPGVVFAGGAEYRIWKDFYAGVDARYHITGGKKDGINVDGLTAGGYLGIGF